VSPGRGIVALVVALVTAVTGVLFVLDLAQANPSPGAVLDQARRFTGRATSLEYTTAVQLDVTAADGTLVRRTRQVSGVDAFHHGWDAIVVDGPTTTEYRATAALPGLLVRSGSSAAALGDQRWTRYGGNSDYVTRVATATSATAPDPAAVSQVVLADDLSGAEAVLLLLSGARDPHRDGDRARRLSVTFDNVVAFPDQGGAVTGARGTLTTDGSGRPQRLDVEVSEGTRVVRSSYVFTAWDATVRVATPPAQDVS
jgi:hypothetical protein